MSDEPAQLGTGAKFVNGFLLILGALMALACIAGCSVAWVLGS